MDRRVISLMILITINMINTGHVKAYQTAGGINVKPLDREGTMCRPCVVGMEQSADDLLSMLSSSSSRSQITSCSGLCGRLVSPLVKEMCIALCNVYGLETFEEKLQTHHDNPLELCIALTSCVTNPQAAGRV